MHLAEVASFILFVVKQRAEQCQTCPAERRAECRWEGLCREAVSVCRADREVGPTKAQIERQIGRLRPRGPRAGEKQWSGRSLGQGTGPEVQTQGWPRGLSSARPGGTVEPGG